jgi:hypothetical protein
MPDSAFFLWKIWISVLTGVYEFWWGCLKVPAFNLLVSGSDYVTLPEKTPKQGICKTSKCSMNLNIILIELTLIVKNTWK